MGEVVEHEIPHTGKISRSVRGQKASLMPCKVFSFFCVLFCIVFCFVVCVSFFLLLCFQNGACKTKN